MLDGGLDRGDQGKKVKVSGGLKVEEGSVSKQTSRGGGRRGNACVCLFFLYSELYALVFTFYSSHSHFTVFSTDLIRLTQSIKCFT